MHIMEKKYKQKKLLITNINSFLTYYVNSDKIYVLGNQCKAVKTKEKGENMKINNRVKDYLTSLSATELRELAEIANMMATAQENQQILQSKTNVQLISEKELKKKVSDVLRIIGVAAYIIVYHYLRTAIILVYNDYRICCGRLNKQIYHEIAKQYKTQWTYVETSIRNIIKKVNTEENYEVLRKYCALKSPKCPLSSSELIAAIADWIQLNS